MNATKKPVRLIARLDIKGENLIKGIHLEGLRVLGDPQEYAKCYYEQGADELIYIDLVASLYGRSKLIEIVRRAARVIFVPMTVGGGIRNIGDVSDLLQAGADKVAINTAAVHRPLLIREVSHHFGAQCMVLSIEAKQQHDGSWEVYTDSGRERSGMDAVEWACRGAELGAGEILATSIDRDGTKRGMDINLISAISREVDIPVIASGGCASSEHARAAIDLGADAIAVGAALHTGHLGLIALRNDLRALGYVLRPMLTGFASHV